MEYYYYNSGSEVSNQGVDKRSVGVITSCVEKWGKIKVL